MSLVSGISGDETKTIVEDNSVLHIKLDVPISENEIENNRVIEQDEVFSKIDKKFELTNNFFII